MGGKDMEALRDVTFVRGEHAKVIMRVIAVLMRR